MDYWTLPDLVDKAEIFMPVIMNELYEGISTSRFNPAEEPPRFFQDIPNWVNENGGSFHPHQSWDYDEKFNGWTLFATDDIEQGEVISNIPWNLLIGGPSVMDLSTLPKTPVEDADGQMTDVVTLEDFVESVTGALDCDAVDLLFQELQHAQEGSSGRGGGDPSPFGPYVEYLNDYFNPILPAMWSESAQRLWIEMLGGMDLGEIPPLNPMTHLVEEWSGRCEGKEEGLKAASILAERGMWNTLMVPTLDWYTHRNGEYTNVEIQVVPGQYFQVIALRNITKGESLHRSLDLCPLCNHEAVDDGYGTPELFRDYGFVEAYPQRWTFQPNAVYLENEDVGQHLYTPEHITFELIHNETSEILDVRWSDDLNLDDRGMNYIRRVFRKHLRKLYRFHNIQHDLETIQNHMDISNSEIVRLMDFFHSLRTALQFSIRSLMNEDDNTGMECHDHVSSNEGCCNAEHIDYYGWHYDDLKWEEDDLNYIYPTCSSTQLLTFEDYEPLEELETNYQKLWFVNRPEDDDICMNLENTLQICSSYRPHYHEFFVHFPARFIDKIERVIFIGGGDSMLLHEVLKYPTLQKVVGLELDQQVTRKSFKYFRSQPHWDNEKVEWWYGDATKSLPLLPRDYWGSFDLVLVDLSETVMSFSVTKTMDIFAALSLLLKPEGVMVKNEPYLDQFSDFFDYSIHVFYGTPKICTQVLVMGSNRVDFLHQATKDHGVERLLMEPLDDDEALRYKYLHDYRKTDAREQGKCNTDDQNTIEHGTNAAGLIEILDAEQVTLDLKKAHIEKIIVDTAKEEGFHPLENPIGKVEDDNVVVLLQEGYIAARVSREHKHIAFDIHSWGAFAKMEALRSALLKAAGAQRSSLYRVVAGGMVGSSTWDADRDSIGIVVAPSRNCSPKAAADSSKDITVEVGQRLALVESVRESIRFLPVNEKVPIRGIILCGFEGDDECMSNAVLTSADIEVEFDIHTFWACPSLKNHTSISEELIADMYQCEVQLLSEMLSLVQGHTDEELQGTEGGDIDMFILDPSAPQAIGQILNSILSVKSHREALVSDRNLLLAFSPTTDDPSWRTHMLERYRKASHFFPVSLATVMFSTAGTIDGNHQKMRLDLAAVDDFFFFQHLKEFEQSLQMTLITVAEALESIEATTVTGGMHYYESEYNAREFPRDAYDSKPALRQQSEQVPLGRQSIFQFELIDSSTGSLSIELLEKSLQDTLESVLGIAKASVRRWSTHTGVGEGATIAAVFTTGSAVLVWDGRTHVDINLYNTADQSKEPADQFVDLFAETTGLTKTLRDDQPRGPGRVVEYLQDMSS